MNMVLLRYNNHFRLSPERSDSQIHNVRQNNRIHTIVLKQQDFKLHLTNEQNKCACATPSEKDKENQVRTTKSQNDLETSERRITGGERTS